MPWVFLDFLLLEPTFPREGAVAGLQTGAGHRFAETTYPREGTVTSRRVVTVMFGPKQLIPARGRYRFECAGDVGLGNYISPQGDNKQKEGMHSA